jgi:hypothetical protein
MTVMKGAGRKNHHVTNKYDAYFDGFHHTELSNERLKYFKKFTILFILCTHTLTLTHTLTHTHTPKHTHTHTHSHSHSCMYIFNSREIL